MALLSPQAAAAELNMSVKTLRGHVRDGSLAYIETGLGSKRARMRFAREDLDEFIAAQSRGPEPAKPPAPTPIIETRARPRKSTRVYFIRAGEFIKIGIARDPQQRLRTLQTAQAERLTLLFDVAGGVEREGRYHTKFNHLWVHGEWFKADPELLMFIEELRGRASE